jgi:hypothetical protein
MSDDETPVSTVAQDELRAMAAVARRVMADALAELPKYDPRDMERLLDGALRVMELSRQAERFDADNGRSAGDSIGIVEL